MDGMLRRFSRGSPYLMAICLAASMGAAPTGGISPVKDIEILADKDGVRPGEALKLAVKVSLAGEFHVNSHVPSTEYLIPTTFELVAPEGLVTADWSFPKGQVRKFSFSDIPLSIYEGTFVIHGSLKATQNSAPGEKEARGTLKYQACTSQRCYPPRKVEASLLVRVVPPGTPVQSLHPELFKAVAP